MFAHMRNVHNISNKAVKKEKAGEFVCPTCGEKKNSDHNLQQHIRKFHENAFPEPFWHVNSLTIAVNASLQKC